MHPCLRRKRFSFGCWRHPPFRRFGVRAVTIGNDFLVLLAVASRLLATGPSTYHWIVVRVPDFIRDQLMHDAVAVIAHCALTGRLMLLIDRAVAQRRGWARYRQHFHSAFCGLVPPARAHHRLSGRARCAGSWLRGWLADWELDHARTIGHAYLALARSWDWSGRLRSIADVSGTHEYSFYSVVLPGSNLSGRTASGLRMYSLVASQGTACFCAVTVCGLNQDIVLGCVIQKLQNSKTVFDMH